MLATSTFYSDNNSQPLAHLLLLHPAIHHDKRTVPRPGSENERVYRFEGVVRRVGAFLSREDERDGELVERELGCDLAGA